MRSEEILRREAEHRAVREALGMYNVALVMAQPCPRALSEPCVPPLSAGPVDSPSSKTPINRVPAAGETQTRKDS
jgi:hypothetical protein